MARCRPFVLIGLATAVAIFGCGRIGFEDFDQSPEPEAAPLPTTATDATVGTDATPTKPRSDATVADSARADTVVDVTSPPADRGAPESGVVAPPPTDSSVDSAPSTVPDSAPADVERPDTSRGDTGSDAAPAGFPVGGTIAGLPAGGAVVLQLNGGDDLTLMRDGAFAFAGDVAAGDAYVVSVLSAPLGTTCNVSSGTGTVSGAAVMSITVDCSPNDYTIGGTLAGLAGGETLELDDNGGDTLFLTANGSFVFMTALASGSAYDVTVEASPAVPIRQTCSVSMGSGTVVSAKVTNVAVTCMTVAPVDSGAPLDSAAPGDSGAPADSAAPGDSGVADSAKFPSDGGPEGGTTQPDSSATYSGACGSSCNCPAGRTCTFMCGGGGCTFNCAAGSICQNTCQGGVCTFVCEANALCENECGGGACTFECEPGSTCQSTCNGGICNYQCNSSQSTCDNSCSGGGICNYDDAGPG